MKLIDIFNELFTIITEEGKETEADIVVFHESTSLSVTSRGDGVIWIEGKK